ncbi:MAG TPA: aminotransferase class V-fold PLP-dependent enzyme [Candidatus Baltobacteraceae bacterium]|nr:aminotransferase class V-fold PLP-dependent enzyme [Candidatus Baltobacteraceae bacterium]
MSTPLPRDEFAVTERYVYLNHAATGVLPRSSVSAIEEFVREQGSGGVLGTGRYEARMPEFRERIARFIGAKGGEIAVLRNTGDGANLVALGLDWRDGDEVILCDNEFPANAIAWIALRRRGVNVRILSTQNERLTPDVLRREITPRTRVVAVSWVSYSDGYRHDLPALARVAHDLGALLCVDAMQALGAFGLDVVADDIDVLYCGAAKWMLALQGVSFCYVRRSLIERLTLAAPGWRSMRDMWDFPHFDQPYVSDASRFEGGTPNFLGALSMVTSIDLIERSGGTAAIASHVLALTDALCDGLQRLGARVASLRGEGSSSGIVTFSIPGYDSVDLGRALLERAGIVTTHRASGVRVAPHGYNNLAEIGRLLETVAQYAAAVAAKQ